MKGDSILGIDPGKTGGFVLLSPGGSILRKERMPLVGDEIDLNALGLMFYEMSDLVRITFLEKVQGMTFAHGRRQGTSSTFNFGKTYGILVGHLSAFRIPFELITPQTWQKQMHVGCSADDAKVRSALAVMKLFPREDFRATQRSTKPHDGLIDAALIAEYGRRKMTGQCL